MQMNRRIIGVSIFLLCCVVLLKPVQGITLSGPITASAVTVSGGVTVSSMTASSTTITNLLDIEGMMTGMSGRAVQMVFSSSTVTTTVSTTSWTAVSDIVQSITLLNANDYIRISLSGGLSTPNDTLPAYITVYRDSINLGDTNYGLAAAMSNSGYHDQVDCPVGIAIIDSPGDTNAHTYQAYIQASSSGEADFPYDSPGYLLLEEMSQ